MTTYGEPLDAQVERRTRLDEALARSQREERVEREHDLARQEQTDERMVRALAERL
jgi:hypothetical protein